MSKSKRLSSCCVNRLRITIEIRLKGNLPRGSPSPRHHAGCHQVADWTQPLARNNLYQLGGFFPLICGEPCVSCGKVLHVCMKLPPQVALQMVDAVLLGRFRFAVVRPTRCPECKFLSPSGTDVAIQADIADNIPAVLLSGRVSSVRGCIQLLIRGPHLHISRYVAAV